MRSLRYLCAILTQQGTINEATAVEDNNDDIECKLKASMDYRDRHNTANVKDLSTYTMICATDRQNIEFKQCVHLAWVNCFRNWWFCLTAVCWSVCLLAR